MGLKIIVGKGDTEKLADELEDFKIKMQRVMEKDCVDPDFIEEASASIEDAIDAIFEAVNN